MRLLIVGCGDVGQRVLRQAPAGVAITILARTPAKLAGWRAQGVRLLQGDLDAPPSLRRLAGFDAVMHLAPPPADGERDRRTRALLAALSRHSPPQRFVYVSTTGIYGDRQGRLTDESAGAKPQTPRARRRVDAEQQLRAWARRHGVQLALLRAPGIYAADREGHPRERLASGRPLPLPEDDGYTNHIHADDLAAACWRALFAARPLRAYNVVDDAQRRTGEHYDLAAEHLGLPKLPRLPLPELRQQLSPMQLSFLGESRRLTNRRLKEELGLRLRYPLPELGW